MGEAGRALSSSPPWSMRCCNPQTRLEAEAQNSRNPTLSALCRLGEVGAEPVAWRAVKAVAGAVIATCRARVRVAHRVLQVRSEPPASRYSVAKACRTACGPRWLTRP